MRSQTGRVERWILELIWSTVKGQWTWNQSRFSNVPLQQHIIDRPLQYKLPLKPMWISIVGLHQNDEKIPRVLYHSLPSIVCGQHGLCGFFKIQYRPTRIYFGFHRLLPIICRVFYWFRLLYHDVFRVCTYTWNNRLVSVSDGKITLKYLKEVWF